MAANGTESLVFTDNVNSDRSSRIISEVYKAILYAQIQSNDPKRTAKATQELFNAKK